MEENMSTVSSAAASMATASAATTAPYQASITTDTKFEVAKSTAYPAIHPSLSSCISDGISEGLSESLSITSPPQPLYPGPPNFTNDHLSTNAESQNLHAFVSYLLDNNTGFLLDLCASSPSFSHYVGITFFSCYRATGPGHLARFLYMLHAHEPLAGYVREMSFDAEWDAPAQSRVFEMLAAVWDVLSECNGVDDGDDDDDDDDDEDDSSDDSDHAEQYRVAQKVIHNESLQVQQEKQRRRAAAATCSQALHAMAEELYLVSFGDPEGLGEDVYVEMLRGLLGACRDVKKVRMPRAWAGWFDAAVVLEAATACAWGLGRDGVDVELY